MIFDIPDAAVEWLKTGERGVSTEAIFAHMTGFPLSDWPVHATGPSDPPDLRRCRLLLEAVPEFAARFAEMAALNERWAWLVPNWDRLCALMDTEAPQWRDGIGTCPLTFKEMR